jgi:hypothetical protein
MQNKVISFPIQIVPIQFYVMENLQMKETINFVVGLN